MKNKSKLKTMRKAWIVVSLVALLIIAGATYYFINSNAEKNKKDLSNQALNLDNKTTPITESSTNKNPQQVPNTKDDQGNDILYKASGKTLTYSKTGDQPFEYYNFYINNELLTWRYGNKTAVSIAASDQMNKTEVAGKNFKIYKTNQDNIVVVYHEGSEGAMGGDISILAWSAVDLSKSQVYSLYSYDNMSLDFGDNKSEVVDIEDNIEENGCDQAKDATEAKNVAPLFKGFLTYYQKVFYKETDNNATLSCDFGTAYDEGGNTYNRVVDTSKVFLGFNSQLTKVYFSAKGKDWQANYSYNFETKKIIKENPSNILTLTLIKGF